MKFVISTQELNYLINKCLNVVSPKPTIPILSNILIEAVNGELILTATDLTVGIRCSTEAKILEEGTITLPAKRFAQLIRELTAVNIEFICGENEIVEILADSSRFKLNGMSRGDFPSLPEMAGAIEFKMMQPDLKDMFFRTSFAVSREDNRYALTGVFLQIANGKATFVGTDGKRLAKAHITLEVDESFSGGYIVPLKAVEEIQKNLMGEGDAMLYLTHDKIGVEANNTRIITKLLTGEYPDVNQIIPEKSAKTITLHRDELSSLLRQISLFTEDSGHSVRFTFTDGELRLSANAMDVGEGKVSMPVNYTGDRMEIAFNPLYLLDILRHTGKSVKMGMTDRFNPGVITDQEENNDVDNKANPLFILMPMRLSEE